MTGFLIDSPENVTLVGGGGVTASCLKDALNLGNRLIGADGGADMAMEFGHMPELVIGDLDSLTDQTRAAMGEARVHHIAEQDSTDFEKCLSRIRARLVLGVGFLGKRLDHQLSVLNVLVRYQSQPCLLLGQDDVVFAAPPGAELTLPLVVGTRVSLFPLMPVSGESTGLRWPIAGLDFAPGGLIGTSNEAEASPVRLQFQGPGMVVILPRAAFEVAAEALLQAGALATPDTALPP